MSLFDGSSKSTTRQESITQNDNSVQNLAAKARATDFSNIRAIKGGVQISDQGIDADTMLELIGAFGLSTRQALDTVAAQGERASQAIADVARSATGTESEAGRLINKLAIPAMILTAVVLLLQSGGAKRTKRRKR